MPNKQSVTKASEGILMCIKNAEEFLHSAEILLIEGQLRESYLLALYAGEELGRVPLIFNYPVHSRSKERLKRWEKRYRDHKEKFWFLRNLEEIEKGFIPSGETEEDSLLKNKRLEICYVDYHGEDFQPPTTIKEEEAKEFIEKIRIRLSKMKERHPSLEVLEEQLAKVDSMPDRSDSNTIDDLKKLMREKGLRDK